MPKQNLLKKVSVLPASLFNKVHVSVEQRYTVSSMDTVRFGVELFSFKLKVTFPGFLQV